MKWIVVELKMGTWTQLNRLLHTIDDQRFVATGQEVAREFVPLVEAAGINAQKPFHPGDQIRLGRLDHQMKMIRHEDIGVDLPAGLGAHLDQGLDKALAVRIVEEDRLPPVAAIHGVVDRAGILDSQLAGHNARAIRAASLSRSRTNPFRRDLFVSFSETRLGEAGCESIHCLLRHGDSGFQFLYFFSNSA